MRLPRLRTGAWLLFSMAVAFLAVQPPARPNRQFPSMAVYQSHRLDLSHCRYQPSLSNSTRRKSCASASFPSRGNW